MTIMNSIHSCLDGSGCILINIPCLSHSHTCIPPNCGVNVLHYLLHTSIPNVSTTLLQQNMCKIETNKYNCTYLSIQSLGTTQGVNDLSYLWKEPTMSEFQTRHKMWGHNQPVACSSHGVGNRGGGAAHAARLREHELVC